MEVSVRGESPDINALASVDERSAHIMVWNYHDDDLSAPADSVILNLKSIAADKILIHYYRIDHTHSNSFTLWRETAALQQVTRDQYKSWKNRAGLNCCHPPNGELY